MKYCSQTYLLRILFSVSCIFATTFGLQAQFTVEVTILDGDATTTRTDGLFQTPATADWGVAIQDEPVVFYSNSECNSFIPPAANFIQYDTIVDCLSDLNGGELFICLWAFDHDPAPFQGCNLTKDENRKDGLEVPCGRFALPTPGSAITYRLDESTFIPTPQTANLESTGFVEFRISVSEDMSGRGIGINDHVCNAIDFGTLIDGATLGNNSNGDFNNFCATNLNEPDPINDGAFWQNENATWFTFTTGNIPNASVLIEATSDPANAGDPVDLQLAVYRSLDGMCDGNLQFVAENYDAQSLDEQLLLECLEANQQYFIMVNGENNIDETGIFGLQISEVSTTDQSNDEICDAISLTLQDGGNILSMFSNTCATSVGDPIVTEGFPITNSVWFKFTPNDSRRVDILVNSNELDPDPMEPEFALFFARGGQCDGELEEVIPFLSVPINANMKFASFDCLNPKETYYILVDGATGDPTGQFGLVVADLGYPDPVQIDTTICEGTVYEIGGKTYANSGIYLDTILVDDCLVITETNLEVVNALKVSVDRQVLARGDGEGGGVMIANAEGGKGNYNIEWSNGQTGLVATDLIGGTDYCVTVTANDIACDEVIECFTMDYLMPITAEVMNDTLPCSYDTTGQIKLTVTSGQEPYNYLVQSIENPMFTKDGVILKNDSLLIIDNLPVGNYNVRILNQFTGNTVMVEIKAPPPIAINIVDTVNVNCFGACDGSIELNAAGGTGDLQFTWSEGLGNLSNLTNICAGNYVVTVTDDNNCVDSSRFIIKGPAMPNVIFSAVQAVDCFGEENGQATVESDVPTANILWENGNTTPMATDLAAGIHKVTLTDDEGCTFTDSVEITQPMDALVAKIELIEAIACGGESNGVLADSSFGGNGDYEYIWSTGGSTALIDNLTAGEYTLTVRDAKGCVDEARITLDEPTLIDAEITPQDVTCPEGPNSGKIIINNPIGGTAPYRFKVANTNFIDNTEITNLQAGTYAVVMQDNNGCERTFDPVVIQDPPVLKVDIGEDQEIRLGQPLSLTAETNQPVTYEWFSTDTLDCLNCKTINSSPSDNAEYMVRVTDLVTGCVAEDAIRVKLLKIRNLYVPNAFSPNGDGINDELGVFGGNDIDKVLRFEIYARNGSLVYKASDFNLNERLSWDGTYNQEKLSPDVFIYFAEVQFIDGAIEVFRGDFTLLR